MSGATDQFTLRFFFNTEVLEDGVNDIILQSQRVTADDVYDVREYGLLAVIDLTADGEVDPRERKAVRLALWDADIRHVHVPVTGAGDIADACTVMFNEVRVASSPAQGVLVHCQMGSDRSVCVATAVLAVRQGNAFDDQLKMVAEDYPDIAVSASMADAARAWVQSMDDDTLIDMGPDPVMTCPHCRGQIEQGLCEGENCGHTVCPFCGDGSGNESDGCTHLVLSLVADKGEEGNPDSLRWFIAGDIRLMSARLPYLVEATDSDSADSLMGHVFGRYPFPWPNGITQPPARGDLLVMAAAIAQACVRGNAVMDFDEDLKPMMLPVTRVYAIDTDGVVGGAIVALETAGEHLAQFGTVGWAEF